MISPAERVQATQDRGHSSWRLRVYSMVSYPIVALWSLLCPPAAVRPQPIFSQYQELPDDMKSSAGINAFLDPKEVAALIGSRAQRRLFQPDLNGLKLLRFVVRGEQEKADRLLLIHPELLLKRGTITDYSGRTFQRISAYEYAYWALDTHMCRMLERHMDAKTANTMHQWCMGIEKTGLTYVQRGAVIEHSHHFDFTPLRSALQYYVDEYDHWLNKHKKDAAWLAIGMAQRDVPVHVANEYCWPDRTFRTRPTFNEEILPRTLRLEKDYAPDEPPDWPWFPLVSSATSGLGIDSAVLRGRISQGPMTTSDGPGPSVCRMDLAAVSRLAEVRTLDLTQSGENLRLIGQELGIGPLG